MRCLTNLQMEVAKIGVVEVKEKKASSRRCHTLTGSNPMFDMISLFKRNILEITLEKTDLSVDIDVDEEGIGRIFKSLGMCIATQVLGYQVKYMGKKSILYAWMAAGINLFCKDVSIKVSNAVTT